MTQRDLKLPWYPVPPYRPNESWTAVSVEGELVATFEDRRHCEAACAAVNGRDTSRVQATANDIARLSA